MGKFSRRASDPEPPDPEPPPWPPSPSTVKNGSGHVMFTIDNGEERAAVRHESVPVIGWKYAQWDWHHQRVTFHGLNGSYDGAPERAVHRGEHDHKAPHASCMCGWNAYRSQELALKYHGYAGSLLQVELWGEVHVYQRGYRAEYQRVLAIHVPLCMCGEEPLRIDRHGCACCLSHVGDPTMAIGFGLLRQYLGPIALVVDPELSATYASLGS